MRYRNYTLFFLAMWMLFISKNLNAQSLNLTGYVRNYSGMLLEQDNKYSIVQNTFDLNFGHRRDKVSFKVNPYLYHYFDSDLDIGLRQAYLDVYLNSLDIRIGKQQIIWGKADGVFITDVVSPKDLREFLLPDFEEIRVGITALKVDYYLGNNTFELVWVPVFTPVRMPEEDSIWRIEPEFPVKPVFDYSKKSVKEKLGNSELFAKYSVLSSLLDLEVMTGYAWDDEPTIHTKVETNPNSHQLSSLTVVPRHHRLTFFGGSFSTTLAGFVIRGEGAYYIGKQFRINELTLTDGVVEKDYLHYLLGVDYILWHVKLSAQFVQQTILNYDESIINDKFENTLTLLASKDFLRETLFVELFSYIGLNSEDALIRPKITYSLADGFDILIGANLFAGSEGRFGQYDNNDMIYSKVKYSF